MEKTVEAQGPVDVTVSGFRWEKATGPWASGEVMRVRCAKELFPDATRRMAEPFRTLPSVTLGDLK